MTGASTVDEDEARAVRKEPNKSGELGGCWPDSGHRRAKPGVKPFRVKRFHWWKEVRITEVEAH